MVAFLWVSALYKTLFSYALNFRCVKECLTCLSLFFKELFLAQLLLTHFLTAWEFSNLSNSFSKRDPTLPIHPQVFRSFLLSPFSLSLSRSLSLTPHQQLRWFKTLQRKPLARVDFDDVAFFSRIAHQLTRADVVVNVAVDVDVGFLPPQRRSQFFQLMISLDRFGRRKLARQKKRKKKSKIQFCHVSTSGRRSGKEKNRF